VDSPEHWSREERRERTLEWLARCDDLRERILVRRGEPVPASFLTRAVKEDRP